MDLNDLDDLPTDDLKAIFVHVQGILGRRSIIEGAPMEADRLAREVLEAEGVACGDPWRQPTGAHDAYPAGWTVTHDGALWESLTPANVWEPGVSGWRREDAPDGPAVWTAPTGAHDAYQTGDRVTWPADGPVWESDIDSNVWEPGVYGWTCIDQED